MRWLIWKTQGQVEQFGCFMRLILDDLQELKDNMSEGNKEKAEKGLDKTIDILQKMLED
jgi:hypothetical protein